MPRLRMLLVVGALALTACSGSGDDAGSAPAVSSPTSSPDDGDRDDGDRDEATTRSEGGLDAAPSDVVPQWSVTVDVAADGFGGGPLETTVGWTGDPNDVVDDGPFGEFASCSGLRDRLGAYSVFVSVGDGGDGEDAVADGVDAVSIWTAARVTGAGIYDAEVRVEPSGAAPPLTASGTMTILAGLQTGEFLAFGPDGGRVEGTFSCSGNDGPSPLPAGSDAAIEVFAILRSSAAERIVALATEPGDAAVCDPDGELVLRVDRDAAAGSITDVEIGAGTAPTIRVRVAGTDYEFDDATVTLGDEPSEVAGAFSAIGDGVSLDGAFTCP